MSKIVFVSLLAGALCLAACCEEKGGGPEISVAAQENSDSSLPARSAGEPTGVADAGINLESESAEAGQEQAEAGLSEGDSQLGEGSGELIVESVATGELNSSVLQEQSTQVAADVEQEVEPAEVSGISGDSQAVARDSDSGGDAGGIEAEVDWRSLALILAAVVVPLALAAASLLGWILGRRAHARHIAPSAKPAAPSVAAASGSAARVPTVLVPTAEGLGELKDELLQAVLTFQNAVDERDAKIKRYEEGYDLGVFKRFLRSFIDVDMALLEALKENPDDENLKNLQKFLDYAFEGCGVRRFEPEVGSLYREARGVQDNPEVISAKDESQDGRIAEVAEPGYEFTEAEEPTLIRAAKVKVQFAEKREES